MDHLKGLLLDPTSPPLSPHLVPHLSLQLPSGDFRYLLFSSCLLCSTLLKKLIKHLLISSQVTTSTEARVGRFSVSRAQEENLDSTQSPPVTQAANGPSDAVKALTPDSSHKASLPSLNNNSFNNSYISSDNDSEFEDDDFKREVNRLREKYVGFKGNHFLEILPFSF